MRYDVRDITNFTLAYADARSIQLTNLSLQKLLYFLHGWFYVVYEQPLIKNKFEAWQFGPVQRVIYDQFKSFRNGAVHGVRATYIDPVTGHPLFKEPEIADDHAHLMGEILTKYERYTAAQLVKESHVEDGPWEYVWKQADEVVFPGMKIPDALIMDHFRRLNPVVIMH